MGKLMDYIMGGNSTPMAGDGFGGTVGPIKSPNTLSSDHASSINSRAPSPRTSRNPSPVPVNTPVNEKDTENSKQMGHMKSKDICSQHLPSGVRAPRCSVATSSTTTAPEASPRSVVDSSQAAVQSPLTTESSENMDAIPWQEYEIPQELETVNVDIPKEIRNIIQESLDEHRAIRASRLQSNQAIVVKTTIETSGKKNDSYRPNVAESYAIASAHSTSNSESRSDYSGSSLSFSHDSTTSLGSDPDDKGTDFEAPTTLTRASTATRHSQSENHKRILELTEMERRFKDSQLRTKKSHKLFKLLPIRSHKGEIMPDSLDKERAISECTSCFDDVPCKKAVNLPCHHSYCLSCFSQLVSTAIQNEATFPPKCCLSEIPKKIMRERLPANVLAQLDEKSLEYAVEIGSRYYCVSSTCGRWIDARIARRTNGALECPHCTVKLCTVCRGPQHPSNEDCPQDYGLDRTLEQAERAGWQRCYNCRAIVELNTGCRHMTCKCRAQFCYTCGARWRTCACTEEDQARREQEIATRLARFDAEQRAEEAEVRAAIAAVEAAERQLQEEREAEEARLDQEARDMANQEFDRLQRVEVYFEYLRGVLDRVRLQQRNAIEKRHDREWEEIDKMKDELDSPDKSAERERYVNAKRNGMLSKHEDNIKILQRKHATAMMETITRHRKDQDDLMAMPTDANDQDAEITRAETLQRLMPAQDLERATLKSQQAREIAKWKSRGEAKLAVYDVRSVVLKMRLDDAEKITKRAKEIKRQIFVDQKWVETIFDERLTMLDEDERRLVASGSEPPEAPRRETVIFPKRIMPEAGTSDAGRRQPSVSKTTKEVPTLMLVGDAPSLPLFKRQAPIILPGRDRSISAPKREVLPWENDPLRTRNIPADEKLRTGNHWKTGWQSSAIRSS